MYHSSADGTLLGVGLYLGHHVVVYLRFDLQRTLEVDIILVRFQVFQLLIRYESQRVLGFRKRHPDPPPEPATVRFRPNFPHLLAAVPPGERRKVSVVTEVRHFPGTSMI